MGQTATISIRQAVAQPAIRTGEPRSSFSIFDLFARFSQARSDRHDRSRARRTALAISEEARIHAQMRYRRMRYRHMQI